MGMNGRLLIPRASGFNPKSISGLTGWWDSQDTSTITLNGSTVSEWRDKSGNGYHMANATAATQPTYAANVFGTKSAPRFANSNTNFLQTNAVYMDALANDTSRLVTMFAVLKTSGDSFNRTIGETGNNSGFGCLHRTGGSAFFDAGADTTARVNAVIAQSVITGGAVFAGRRSGGNVDQWYNNVAYGTRTNATNAIRTGTHAFGITGTGGGTLAYAEILIYNVALSTTDRQRVQSYLASKYGITLS